MPSSVGFKFANLPIRVQVLMYCVLFGRIFVCGYVEDIDGNRDFISRFCEIYNHYIIFIMGTLNGIILILMYLGSGSLSERVLRPEKGRISSYRRAYII